MSRCAAKTKTGRRCLNEALPKNRFCGKHSDRFDPVQAILLVGGALLGNAFAPGIGGVAAGSGAGWLLDHAFKGGAKVKRVFVSYDFDNDRALKEFIIGQSKLADSPFSVVDCSLKEAAPMKTWEEKARRAIKTADLVLVMVGPKTSTASGVLKEVAMARDEGIKIVQVIGYKEREYTAVPGAGKLYRWNWENLKGLLS